MTASKRSAAGIARQQAGYRTRGQMATAADFLVVRVVALHESLIGTSDWRARHGDLRSAATAAGLVASDNGFGFEGGEPPPDAYFDHMTLSGEVRSSAIRSALLMLWCQDSAACAAVPSYDPSQVFRVLDETFAASMDAYSWASWVCHLTDDATAESVNLRALAEFVGAAGLDLRRSWTPGEMFEMQRRWALLGRHSFLDAVRTADAMRDVGVRAHEPSEGRLSSVEGIAARMLRDERVTFLRRRVLDLTAEADYLAATT